MKLDNNLAYKYIRIKHDSLCFAPVPACVAKAKFKIGTILPVLKANITIYCSSWHRQRYSSAGTLHGAHWSSSTVSDGSHAARHI